MQFIVLLILRKNYYCFDLLREKQYEIKMLRKSFIQVLPEGS